VPVALAPALAVVAVVFVGEDRPPATRTTTALATIAPRIAASMAEMNGRLVMLVTSGLVCGDQSML
jgi:hypothetical protein